jgi:hypothetical protein
VTVGRKGVLIGKIHLAHTPWRLLVGRENSLGTGIRQAHTPPSFGALPSGRTLVSLANDEALSN